MGSREDAEAVVGRLESEGDVKGLIAALEHTDLYMRMHAAMALGRLGDVRAVEPLIQALKDEVDWVRRDAIKALGELGDARAVDALGRALLNETHWGFRGYAAEALGKIGEVRAVKPLTQALKDEDNRVQLEAATVLAQFGEKEGIKTLKELTKQRQPWASHTGIVYPTYLEIESAKRLYQFGDSSGAELLIEYLDHPEPIAVDKALQALSEIKVPESVEEAKKRLPQFSQPSKILSCIAILAGSGDYSELPRLLEFLTTGSKAARQYAAQICGNLGLNTLLKPLQNQLSMESDKDVRQTIEKAIESIERTQTVAEMPELKVVEDPLELITQLGEKLLQDPLDKDALERKVEMEIQYFTAQIEKGNDRQKALNRLGFAHLFKGGVAHHSEAEKCFQQVLSENPDDATALFGLARLSIMLLKRDRNENLNALLKAEKIATAPLVDLYSWPGNDLYLWLGKCFFEWKGQLNLGDLPKAIEYLEKAIKLNENVIMAHTLLGRALLANLNLDRAIDALQQAVKLHPQDGDPHLYLAAIYQGLGEHQQAQQHLELADKLFVHPRRLTSQILTQIHTQVRQAQRTSKC